MEIVTIDTAKANGLSRFFNGIPCKHGHLSERYTRTGNCCECNRLRNLSSNMTAEQRQATRDRQRLAQRERRLDPAFREKERASNADYEKRRRSNAQFIELKRIADRERHSRNRAAMTPEQKLELNRRRRAERDSNPLRKSAAIFRILTHKAFSRRSMKKGTKTSALLGCDWLEAKMQIEKQFLRGMSWDNFGEWHIDHITPLSCAKTEQELAALCHISNLRPIWGIDNLSKGSKVEFLI